MSLPIPEKYRLNVGIFVLDAEGCILACERSDVQGAWQIPQGGIDVGEDSQSAMFRELEEEIGTRAVEIIARYPGSIRYEWPAELYHRGFRGQEQEYYFARLQSEAVIRFDLHAVEFRDSAWLGVSEFVKRVHGFKADAYKSAIAWFQSQYPNVLRN